MPTPNANGNRIVVYGTTWCPGWRLTRAVLEQRQMDCQWIAFRTVPTILLADGRVLTEPSRRELQRALMESATAARVSW